MTHHGIDLAALRKELDGEAWELSDEPDREVRRVYLGTVFVLMPSGKFYTPFACSNVAGDCVVCGGSGKVQPRVSRRRFKKARRMLETYALRTAKRCVSPAARVEYVHAHAATRARLFALTDTTCPRCDGLGSQSAADDERWRESLERDLAEMGLYLTAGEGDPCDLFVEESRDVDEDTFRDSEDDSEAVANEWPEGSGG